MKVDTHTLSLIHDENAMAERGRFARICTEVDLKKKLLSKFRFRGRKYSVETNDGKQHIEVERVTNVLSTINENNVGNTRKALDKGNLQIGRRINIIWELKEISNPMGVREIIEVPRS